MKKARRRYECTECGAFSPNHLMHLDECKLRKAAIARHIDRTWTFQAIEQGPSFEDKTVGYMPMWTKCHDCDERPEPVIWYVTEDLDPCVETLPYDPNTDTWGRSPIIRRWSEVDSLASWGQIMPIMYNPDFWCN